MNSDHIELGDYGEGVALEHLLSEDYTLVTRNWRSEGGEIDLVMMDGAVLVFVEVKTRIGDRFGSPEESITPAKGERLNRLAMTYLMEHDQFDQSWRIDVVAIEATAQRSILRLDHYVNAIEGSAWIDP